MDLNKIKLVTDSSSDLLTLEGVDFAVAPLRILTDQEEFVDDRHLHVPDMVRTLAHYHGRSSTACPGPGDWLNAFGDAEIVLCVTITSNLSGSHNAACVAREHYLQVYPDRQVYILDSLSVGPEMQLLLTFLRDGLLAGQEMQTLWAELETYRQRTRLLFMLESMKNLANNGRVKHITAKAAGLLGIRAIGKASDQGTLEMLGKARGADKALDRLAQYVRELGWQDGKVRIGHCGNPTGARTLRALLLDHAPQADIQTYPCRGLCSFYAEAGGLLVGFETT